MRRREFIALLKPNGARTCCIASITSWALVRRSTLSMNSNAKRPYSKGSSIGRTFLDAHRTAGESDFDDQTQNAMACFGSHRDVRSNRRYTWHASVAANRARSGRALLRNDNTAFRRFTSRLLSQWPVLILRAARLRPPEDGSHRFFTLVP